MTHSPSTNGTSTATVLRHGLFSPLELPLKRVEELLQAELRSETPFIDELLIYVADQGGKRLRPALVLLAAQASGKLIPEHTVLAAVIEMIHIATLIHDDILDDALTRRHRLAVHRRWDTQSSVLLGDYLFSHAFYLASTLGSAYACRIIGQSTNRVCAGELRQVGSRGNLQISEAEYFQIIHAKTAELCACSTHLGSHYAGADEATCRKLERYGRDLGMAFQIADDLLDLTGNETETGKSLGTDLEKQKLTLPLIHCLEQAQGSDREALRDLLASTSGAAVQRERLVQLLSEYGSIAYARQASERLIQSATDQLEGLPATPAKEALVALADFVISRSH